CPILPFPRSIATARSAPRPAIFTSWCPTVSSSSSQAANRFPAIASALAPPTIFSAPLAASKASTSPAAIPIAGASTPNALTSPWSLRLSSSMAANGNRQLNDRLRRFLEGRRPRRDGDRGAAFSGSPQTRLQAQDRLRRRDWDQALLRPDHRPLSGQ